MRIMVGVCSLLALAGVGCLGAAPAGERGAARAVGPIDAQVTWKELGVACPVGFVTIGKDPAWGTDGRQAICVHEAFCEARPAAGDYCAAAPKSVVTTDAVTFWSDFLVTCPAVGPLVAGAAAGTAEIHVADASAPGGARTFVMDGWDVGTRWAADGHEPCLTNGIGAGLRDPSCDGGEGTACSVDVDAVVECTSTWVDDRRGGESHPAQRIEVLARRACASGICEAPSDARVACQEDRALLPASDTLDDQGAPARACGPGRALVDAAGAPMCLASSYCDHQTPGLYCDGAPSGLRDTTAWGALDEDDLVQPGALVIAGNVAVECGRDASGRATTALYPCASGTCVGNAVGFGCVDTSCESANDADLAALWASGDDEAIAAVEGAYCSTIREARLLSCQLVQAWDAGLEAHTVRLLPMSYRACSGDTPVCATHAAGTADACEAAPASSAE